MMKRKTIGIIASAILVGGFLAPASAAPSANADYIVVFKNGVSSSASASALARIGATPAMTFSSVFNGAVINVSAAQARQMELDPNVLSIEKDGLVQASGTQAPVPSWGLDRIDQTTATLNGNYIYPESKGVGVTIYIVDTGIAKISDFGTRLLAGCSVFPASGESKKSATSCALNVKTGSKTVSRSTIDDNGHGTHVSGTTAGTNYGVAKSANLVPVKVLDSRGSGSTSGVVAGLDWVRAQYVSGTRVVVNMSLGGGISNALDTAVANLVSAGVTVVVAAGNSTTNACSNSPARVPGALTVGATQNDSLDGIASYSNYGSCVDLFAPGSNIVSDSRTGTAATMSGTSMASPHVAGVAALVLSSGYQAPSTLAATILGASSTNNPVKLSAAAIAANTPNKMLLIPN